MTPAHITRLLTLAQTGQPTNYIASDLMKSDIEALVWAAGAAPVQQEPIQVCRLMKKEEGIWVAASEFYAGNPAQKWVDMVSVNPEAWSIQHRVTGKQIADGLAKALAGTPVQRELSKAQIDAIVYECRQAGEDTTYAIVNSALRTAPLAPAAKVPECQWSLDDDDSSTWQTACGALWQFTDGGPTENLMTYCHHCGSKVALEAAPQPKEPA